MKPDYLVMVGHHELILLIFPCHTVSVLAKQVFSHLMVIAFDYPATPSAVWLDSNNIW